MQLIVINIFNCCPELVFFLNDKIKKAFSPSSSSFVMVIVRPLQALTTEREREKGGGLGTEGINKEVISG